MVLSGHASSNLSAPGLAMVHITCGDAKHHRWIRNAYVKHLDLPDLEPEPELYDPRLFRPDDFRYGLL